MNHQPHARPGPAEPARRSGRAARLGAAALGLLLHAAALAQGITLLDSRNGSTDYDLTLTPTHALHFASELEVSPLAADFVARTTNVFGNFTVGAASVLDTGSFSEFLGTPALAYGREAADAGGVNGSWNGLPVVGSASFASGASYVFEPARVVGQGHAETTGATPYDHVSLAANAIGLVRLEFTVAEITPFTLSGAVLATRGDDVGGRTSQGLASVQFSGCIGCLWTADVAPGAFDASGLLMPGITYQLRGNASSRLNGSGEFAFELLLGPVHEPAAWLLLAAGLPLLLRRRSAGAV